MLRIVKKNESIQTSNFGGFSPYWTTIDGKVVTADTAEEIITALPEEKRLIDPIAVFELLQFNYILGNRTIVRGIYRMPWHSVLRGDGILEKKHPLPHLRHDATHQEAAEKLRVLLEEEIYDIVKYHRRIFLLLTGGLDSRVVAGIIKKIEHRLNTSINCITWGHAESRDVVYAKRIASMYDWNHIHVPYDHETTWENILSGAIWGGSEVAGFHLHGKSYFKKIKSDDLVIAASFGDSIGRAEFSSVHLSNLTLRPLQNTLDLIHPSLMTNCLNQAEKDRETAWYGEEESPDYVRFELDMQENYMRRMICHVMNYIRQFCSLHQAFTSDKIVLYMWSLPLMVRTDEIYFQLLKNLDTKLYSLPWARTGVAPDGSKESNAMLRKQYHEYGKWLRNELRAKLKPLVFSSGLQKLGLFYQPSIQTAWKKFISEPESQTATAQTIVKIASLEISRRYYKIKPCRKSTYWQDIISNAIRHGLKKTRLIGKHVHS